MMKKIFLVLIAIVAAAVVAVNAQTVQVWRGGQVRTTLMNADSITFVENEDPATADEYIYAPNRNITGQNYDQTKAVRLNQGTYVGFEKDSVLQFYGIPYGQQPVGDLRFQRAKTLPASNDVYEAFHFAHSACQEEEMSEPASMYEQGDDMLALNIWASEIKPNDKKPVMVYIHGGGYTLGGSADPLYNGHNFVKKNPDIILVTINYRINLCGYLNAKKMDDGNQAKYQGVNANLAHLDQIDALWWVRHNIGAFGGDSTNITVFGESAGCVSAGIVAVSPLAKDNNGNSIVRNVIMQSGGMNVIQHPDSLGGMEWYLRDSMGISNMADLENLSFVELRNVWLQLSGNMMTANPNADSTVIPADPVFSWKDNAADGINVLQGYNSGEFTYFMDCFPQDMYIFFLENVERYLEKSVAPENLPTYRELREEYYAAIRSEFSEWTAGVPAKDSLRFLEEVADDWLFLAGHSIEAAGHAQAGGNSYFYFFDYCSQALTDKGLRVCHAAEVPYVFNNEYGFWYQTEEELEVSDIVQTIWANFARTGKPDFEYTSDDGMQTTVNWPQYDADSRKVVVIDRNPYIKDNFRKERSETLEKMMKLSPTFHFSKFLTGLLEP